MKYATVLLDYFCTLFTVRYNLVSLYHRYLLEGKALSTWELKIAEVTIQPLMILEKQQTPHSCTKSKSTKCIPHMQQDLQQQSTTNTR